MCTLSVIRALSPLCDYVVSVLGSFGVVTLFHHFIVLDDVVAISETGVPLGPKGRPVEILEYANTAEVRHIHLQDEGFYSPRKIGREKSNHYHSSCEKTQRWHACFLCMAHVRGLCGYWDNTYVSCVDVRT